MTQLFRSKWLIFSFSVQNIVNWLNCRLISFSDFWKKSMLYLIRRKWKRNYFLFEIRTNLISLITQKYLYICLNIISYQWLKYFSDGEILNLLFHVQPHIKIIIMRNTITCWTALLSYFSTMLMLGNKM